MQHHRGIEATNLANTKEKGPGSLPGVNLTDVRQLKGVKLLAGSCHNTKPEQSCAEQGQRRWLRNRRDRWRRDRRCYNLQVSGAQQRERIAIRRALEAAGKIHYLADTKVVPSCTSSDRELTKARAVDQFRVGKGSTLTEKSSNVTGIWAASCSR